MSSSQPPIPATPRVISPSPTPSEQGANDGYFPPTTRAKAVRTSSVTTIEEHRDDHDIVDDDDEDPELSRARARSRQRRPSARAGEMNGTVTSGAATTGATTRRKKTEDLNTSTSTPNGKPNGKPNGFLSPDSAYPRGFGSAYWRNLSRSPSPLGLIPIHREWRVFIHKHEIPRKFLHVSIGFLGLGLYYANIQPDQIHPILLYMLVPIFTVDLIRFRWEAFNKLYIKVMGALMRESEAHDRFNGVISYLAGLWLTLRFCSKDVSIMSVLLLSWCDTAASTFGRLWGKYTPRIRRGKSLAGSLAAFGVGVVTAAVFWGILAPWSTSVDDTGINSFGFQGTLTLPAMAREQLGWSIKQATISGPTAVGVLSVISGVIVSVSEAIDAWGLDDNLTIPIFCGIGLSGFLWCFGSIGSYI